MGTFKVYDLCLIAVLCSLGVVLSSFLQIPIFSDIRIDLSYIVITYISFRYGGGYGGICAAIIAGVESWIFTSYGFSLSWTCANLFIGLVLGLVFCFNQTKKQWLKHSINIFTIIVTVAIAMLVIKSSIEVSLYSLSWEIKLPKNAVAFVSDCLVMIIGYLVVLPRLLKIKENKNEKEFNINSITDGSRTNDNS